MSDPRWALAQRIIASSHLNSSPKLCDFFLYVVDCCLRNAPEEATEQQIGVHVFHRIPGYNSSDDSIVRSQARLLRMKLTAYFSNEGSHEEKTGLTHVPWALDDVTHAAASKESGLT